MQKIAVLIPCYNESVTIQKVVEDFKAVLPEAVIYVYDNNSSDHTDEIAKQAGAVVRYEYRQGKGNVIRRDVYKRQALIDAADFVAAFQNRQGLYISCIEEIAYRRGFIDREQLLKLAEPIEKTAYGQYLLDIAEGL